METKTTQHQVPVRLFLLNTSECAPKTTSSAAHETKDSRDDDSIF